MTQEKSTLLQNVTLIDGNGSEPQTHMDVLVAEDPMSAIGSSGNHSVNHLMTERGVFLVPTLATNAMTTHGTEIPSFMAEIDRNLGDAPQRSVRAALAAGVPIAMGTDAGFPFVRHGDNAIELVLMVEAGLSPMQSIVASTSNAALALGLQNEIGTIEVGQCAGLLVIDGDPLSDINVLTQKERIRMVIHNGRMVVNNLNS